MDYKYCLVVSQYYHSYHMAIVEIDENFLKKARTFVSELEKHKRDTDYKPPYYGDLDQKYERDEFRHRYNLNDEGDMYFILSDSANDILYDHMKYLEQEKQLSRQFKKKTVIEAIQKHHDKNVFYEIVKKHFKFI